MRKISVEYVKSQEEKVEIVERKGIGHPDTICDSIMESISIALSQEYLKKAGHVLHYNIDKGLLVAGSADVRFGGGEVIEPMKLIIGDRATFKAEGIDFAVNEIAIQTAKKWFKENLRFIDADSVIYQSELKQGSPELVSIFKKQGLLGSNDTSASVGYAPLSKLEKTVLETERFLNSKEFKKQHPETGEDVKVMGLRRGESVSITIAMSFVDRFINNEEEYFKAKEEVIEEIKQHTGVDEIVLNALDKKGKGIEGVYLTVTGTSAEAGDCGQVGRGNRTRGLISLNRPSGSEATAGKNPVSHIGKIYNVLSNKIAEEIFKSTGVPNYTWMTTRIGSPIDQPMVSVQLEKQVDENQVREVINKELDNIQQFCTDLAKGKYKVC